MSYKHPARRLLTAIRFQLGYGDENFKDLSRASIDKLDSQLLSASAQELFKVGKLDEAEQLMQRANQLEPENEKIIYQQGIIKLFKNDNSAIEFFKLALEKNPEFDAASISLIIKLTTEKKYNEAFEVVDKLKNRNPLMAYGLIGGIYLHKGDVEKAKNAFTRVVVMNENHIGGLFNLAKIAQQEKSLEEAVEYYKRILKINKHHLPSISSLIQLSVNKQLQTSIKGYFKANLVESPEDSVTSIALAEYYLTQKEIVKAKKVALQGLKVLPNDRALLLINAKIETYLKNYDGALDYLNEATQDKKETLKNAMIYASKSTVFLLKGDLSSAITEQERAVKSSVNKIVYELNLVRLYLKNNNLKAARELVYDIDQGADENVDLIELKGHIAFLDGDYQQAATLLSKVHSMKPSEQVALEMITAMQKLGKQKEALTLINNIQNKKPSLMFQLKKAELYAKEEPDRAITIYKELIKKTNSHYVLQNNLAWLYLAQKENDKALQSAKIAMKSAPQDSAVQDTYGVVLLALGHNVRALEVLKNAAESEKAKLSYKVHYAEALIANNFNHEARKILDKINEQELKGDLLTRFLSTKALL